MELKKANIAANVDRYDHYMQPLEEFFQKYQLDYRQPSTWHKFNVAHFEKLDTKDLTVANSQFFQQRQGPVTKFKDGIHALVLAFRGANSQIVRLDENG